MIAGRFLAGIGIGLSSALVPLYISEVPARPPLSGASTHGPHHTPNVTTWRFSTQRRCSMACWL
jgi:hypothetical protein